MSRCWFTAIGGLAALPGLLAGAAQAPEPPAGTAYSRVQLQNNQPFAVRMPIRVRGLALANGEWTLDGKDPVQPDGTNAVWMVDLTAGARKSAVLQRGGVSRPAKVQVEATPDGVALSYLGKPMGKLSWGIVVRPAKAQAQVEEAVGSRAHENFERSFEPMKLMFQKTVSGAVFDRWLAEGRKSGLVLNLELLSYAEGFVDLNARLINESADENAKVYAAVVCRWEQAGTGVRSMCYDNRISPLADQASSPFRAGEGRHQFTQRGVDWVRTQFKGGITAVWLNDFAPSFTLVDRSTKNTFKQPRYEGANLPQLGQELQTGGTTVFSITEIARDNIRSYRDRLAEYALPARGEGPAFSSRLVFTRKALNDAEADQTFVAFTSYNEQARLPDGVSISFGVAAVRFGTSYFPYSTLGENFDRLKLPGMDRDAFWPLAADTVLRWRDFADDIRRDLRIAKAMGFELIRLHHLELLAAIPESTRLEYLDFLFGELRHLELRVLVDLYASDAALQALLRRYGDVIEGVELENEILIWGIPLDRPAQWKSTYAAVKAVAPKAAVNLTGYNNTGMFDRLAALGVPFDRIGLHSYVDALDAIPTARGYALALGSYGSRAGKPPVITEWNWRQLTRMTPEARAQIYPTVFENALATRAIPEMYQFQFNETLAPNPRTGRGNVLRHYELLHLSRRPKLEALELMKLIQKYRAKPAVSLDVQREVTSLDSSGKGETLVRIKNTGTRFVTVKAAVEAGADLEVAMDKAASLTLAPGAMRSVKLMLKAAKPVPGFYHAFLRLEAEGWLQYAWVEARLAGSPALAPDADPEVSYDRGIAEELKLDFSRGFAVVYGRESTVLEVETAFAVAEALESACGQPIEALQENDLASRSPAPATVIVVGMPKSCALIGSSGVTAARPTIKQVKGPAGQTWLLVSGADAAGVERAGMDLLLHWWRLAGDSAARKIGLVAKELPRGGDATKLP